MSNCRGSGTNFFMNSSDWDSAICNVCARKFNKAEKLVEGKLPEHRPSDIRGTWYDLAHIELWCPESKEGVSFQISATEDAAETLAAFRADAERRSRGWKGSIMGRIKAGVGEHRNYTQDIDLGQVD